MKKILVFADSNLIHTIKWVEFLKKDFEVVVLTFNKNNIEGIKTINICSSKVNPSGNNLWYLKKIFLVKKIILRENPDIINAHFLYSYGFIASLVCGRIPLAISTHGTDVLVMPNRNILYKLISKYALKKADFIFSVASHMTTAINNLYKGSSSKSFTIQYGVNTDIMEDSIRDIDFVSTRNLLPNSNIDIIIDAFSEYIHKTSKPSKLYILGSGTEENRLKQMVLDSNLEKNVFFTGNIDNKELISILNRSKFFISFTSSDGTPLSLLEAMSAGCIPIVSSIIANKDWVNSENGYSSKINKDSLCDILNNCQYSDEIVKKNIDIVKTRGDYTKNTGIINKILINLTK